MTVQTTQGQCEYAGCYDQAIVGLQSKWYCLVHFERVLKGLGEDLRALNELTKRAAK